MEHASSASRKEKRPHSCNRVEVKFARASGKPTQFRTPVRNGMWRRARPPIASLLAAAAVLPSLVSRPVSTAYSASFCKAIQHPSDFHVMCKNPSAVPLKHSLLHVDTSQCTRTKREVVMQMHLQPAFGKEGSRLVPIEVSILQCVAWHPQRHACWHQQACALQVDVAFKADACRGLTSCWLHSQRLLNGPLWSEFKMCYV